MTQSEVSVKLDEKALEAAMHAYANSGPEKWHRMKAAVRAYLAALAPVEAEPVAWIVSRTDRTGAMALRLPLLRGREEMERYQLNNPDETLIPLFTHPPAAQPPDDVAEGTGQKCSICDGLGYVPHYNGMTEARKVCENCGGSGSITPMTDAEIEAWIYAEPYEPKRIALRELIVLRALSTDGLVDEIVAAQKRRDALGSGQ